MFATNRILKDRYQLQRRLSDRPGRETWLAQDLDAKQPVVVKLLLFGGPIQWQDIRLFEREAKILEQLEHPAIPTYCCHFSLEDCRPTYLGLVQAYIAGESLQECLDGGQHFREKDLQAIAEGILAVLTYLHKHQPPILHRDIKPSNLMRDNAGHVYLVDFGSVQTANATPGRSFTVVGTYGYTPMEQFGGRAVPASDLHALGCTLAHLATGRSPADLMQWEGRIDVAANTTLSPSFARWLQGLCEPHVSQRPQSARAAYQGLLAAAATRDRPPAPATDSPRPLQDRYRPPAKTRLATRSWQSLMATVPSGLRAEPLTDGSINIHWEISLKDLFHRFVRFSPESHTGTNWIVEFLKSIAILFTVLGAFLLGLLVIGIAAALAAPPQVILGAAALPLLLPILTICALKQAIAPRAIRHCWPELTELAIAFFFSHAFWGTHVVAAIALLQLWVKSAATGRSTLSLAPKRYALSYILGTSQGTIIAPSARHAIVAVKLVYYLHAGSSGQRDPYRWVKAVEVWVKPDDRRIEVHSLPARGPDPNAAATWIARVLGLWAGLPVVGEFDIDGARTTAHL